MNKFKLITTTALAGVFLSQPVLAADNTLKARIEALEKEIALLKRQSEVTEEKAVAAAGKNALVELNSKGLNISSPDKKYQFGVHGVFQIDNRSFINDEKNNQRSEVLVRRARPILNVKAGNAAFTLTPDFGGSTTRLADAYADYKFNNAASVRAGKFKAPIGLEQLQSDPDTLFTERGLPSALTSTRDIGVQLSGQVIPNIVDYQVGIFNGAPDLGNIDTDPDDKKDLAARVFAKPFTNSNVVALQGLGLGVGSSFGKREGTTSSPNLGSYTTPGQQTFFRYRTSTTLANNAYARGEQWRLDPQAYWYYGNKGVLAEYAISSQDVVYQGNRRELQNTAWQVAGSYVITGENATFSGGIKPEQNFNPSTGAWGAFEAIARVGQLEIDENTFPIFADANTSARQATSVGAGVNWYLDENLKLAVNYNHTGFEGGDTNGKDRPEEHAILSRVQYRF
jgi:phosphate-selective porin OprO/OprP